MVVYALCIDDRIQDNIPSIETVQCGELNVAVVYDQFHRTGNEFYI
jgi:hypothetical protein